MTRRPRDQRGAAVVIAIALIGVLVLVAVACAGSVAIVLAHRRAQVAADLAALAGGSALQRGADPCVEAARIADRHHARVTGCVVDGPSVVVLVAVGLAAPLGGGEVPARARAGPVRPTCAHSC